MTSDLPAAAGLPRRLLLATDLSYRCDRALDRAVALCREWDAELVVVHALEPHQSAQALATGTAKPQDRGAMVEWRLRRDLAPDFAQPVIVVEEAEPSELVLRVAAQRGCDLIVTGVARDDLFGRVFLGSTVDEIVRRAGVAVLVVKDRPHGPYKHLVAATDFSPASRAALLFGIGMRREAITLFHAFDAPFSGWTGKTQYLAEARNAALATVGAFLGETDVPASARAGLQIVVEHGSMAGQLAAHVRNQLVDLVLIGLPERGLVLEALIGSRARAALDQVPCDIMLVPAEVGVATSSV